VTNKVDTWMPLLIDTYLGDTPHLTTEQHGAYLKLLMALWKRGGQLPVDDGQLAAITGLSPARWKAHKPVLMEFFTVAGEYMSQKRLSEELERAKKVSEAKAEAGAKGAAKRWQRDSGADGAAMADPLAKGSLADAPIPIHAPSEQKKGAIAPSSPAVPATLPLPGLSAVPMPAPLPACPHRDLIAMFVTAVPELPRPRVELWDGKKAEAMRARWRWVLTARRDNGERYATNAAEALQWFGRFFAKVGASDFLTGRGGARSKFTLDWLMKKENFDKVVEHGYPNQEAA